ncbi:unnamed protein product [Callosobruchus maculatus]|uniref:Uncharacterized protein n=1 Tax=Callosobruchus maculatus TaxID=64391 RepID=A0A653D2K6_CALMS|nr:unnamed protein product [Callosobruchus maculatus]
MYAVLYLIHRTNGVIMHNIRKFLLYGQGLYAHRLQNCILRAVMLL